MEITSWCCVLGVTPIFMLFAWKFSNWLRFVLRARTHDGSSYRFMFEEGKSKPISLTHLLTPRVSPFFYRSFTTHEFEVGDKVMLKVSSWKGVVWFEKNGIFSPSFLGPFTVLKRVGSQAYKLDLPPQMHEIHDVFDVGYIHKCMPNQHVIPLSDVEIDDEMRPHAEIHDDMREIIDNHEMRYSEEPEAILDTKIKRLRNKQIFLVKVQWRRHHHGANVSWEPRDEIRKRFPHLFA